MLKEEGLRKAAIEERKARASENKLMSLLLAKENKIMSMNRDDMDNLTKTCHDMARREILKKRMVASAGLRVPVMFSLLHMVATWMISVRELGQAPEVDSVVPMNFKMDSLVRSEDRPR